MGGRSGQGVRQRAQGSDISRISATEATIANQRFETGILYDANGNQIAYIDGAKDHVLIPRDLMERATVFTHNHPGGSSFSLADVKILSLFSNLNEIRAVSINYLYVMKYNGPMIGSDKTTISYNVAKTRVTRRIDKLVESGRISAESITGPVYHHQIMKEFSKITGFEYKRIKR